MRLSMAVLMFALVLVPTATEAESKKKYRAHARNVD